MLVFIPPYQSKLNSQRKREPFAFTSLSNIFLWYPKPMWESPPLHFLAPGEKSRILLFRVTAFLLGVKVFEQTWSLIYNQNTCDRHSLLNQHWFKIKWAIHRRGCMRNREMEIKATIKYNFYTHQIDKN